jgi:hypothetical protein
MAYICLDAVDGSLMNGKGKKNVYSIDRVPGDVEDILICLGINIM